MSCGSASHWLVWRLGREDLDGLTACFGCGLYIPYIRKMLETGRTAFPLIPPGSTRPR